MHKATILLVDDNPTNLKILLDHLNASSYKLLISPNGEQALQQVEYAKPDLILLDVMMPGMDGFETCQKLKDREDTRDIPVIFMTALSDTVDKVKGFDVGGVDYITKPLQVEEVLARVDTHLSLRRLQRNLEEKNAQLEEEITRRKEAEEKQRMLNEQLEVTNQELQEANASKDKFFSIIAHDLRSPFNWLIGLTQVILENIEHYSKEDIQKIIGQLHASTKKVYDLLTNLLAWSRLQRGLMDHHPDAMSLDEVAEHNVQLFSSGAEQKQISLRHTVPQDTLIYADRNMVDTVIRNLISNAMKFTEAEGTIEVTARQRDDGMIEVAVADTGRGMSEENQAKLFRIDVKYISVGTAGEKGSGLGLLLCKELVETNGGDLWVESEEGTGTTFRFTLPQAERQE